jgi:hypothetical protein
MQPQLYHMRDFTKKWVTLITLLLQKLLRNMDGTVKPPIYATCTSCAKGKAKRKKIVKVAKNVATMKGGSIFFYISFINVQSKGGN